ncbi:MAG TPA: hypothetical protein VGL77_16195, partial [Armatimonadota bacterium]
MMSPWKRLLPILCLCVCALGSVKAAGLAGSFSSELDTDHYDCVLTLLPATTASRTNAVRLTLEWGTGKGYLQAVITKTSITLYSIQGSKKVQIGQATPAIISGAPYHLVLMRRGSSLGLMHNDTLLFRGEVPSTGGNEAGIVCDSGWTLAEKPRIQRLEPVIFADDFMRSKDEPGPWKVVSGQWGLSSAWDRIPHGNTNRFSNTMYAQNPFAWVGMNRDGGSATCMVGEPFWEDYTFATAVRAGITGAFGAVVNMTDAKNGLLVRWSPVTDHSARGNRLILYALVNGEGKELASSPGGYLPNQWYKLSLVTSLDGLHVFTDGTERLAVKNIAPWRGGVALYAEGKEGVTFDDVSVYGRTLNTDLLLETQQSQMNQRFAEDRNGMKDWSDSRSDWTAASGLPNHYWFHRDIYGDHEWMAMTVRPTPFTSGELWMTLNGDGQNPTSGDRATIQLSGTPGKVTCTIYHDMKQLATKTIDPLPADVDYTLRFWRVGTKLTLEMDDATIVAATDNSPATGLRPAYRANGCFATARNVLVLSRNMMDYTFANAPADWLDQGTWMPTIRWSCAPQWSFLAGWSRGEASMWHKQRFVGDQSFEAFVGIKMEYPREREIYPNRYRDMAITICGDGLNPRSGYSGVYASSDIGDGSRRLVLMRNGEVVASRPLDDRFKPNQGANHRSWFDLELRKHGATVDFVIKFPWIKNPNNEPEILSLTFTDPKPIAGGLPAIWTTDNGISIARARLNYANPPQPNIDPMVTIDDPWYPDWADLNHPLTLAFPNSASTDAKPITLKTQPLTVPGGDEAAIKPEGQRVTFQPTKTGFHWYKIFATDGEVNSPAFHLNLPVFD